MQGRYRIWRIDSRNIAIQERVVSEKNPEEKWKTRSYHGNSLNSLISGLFNLIMAQYIPEDEKLLESVKTLQLAVVSGIEEVKELLETYNDY